MKSWDYEHLFEALTDQIKSYVGEELILLLILIFRLRIKLLK